MKNLRYIPAIIVSIAIAVLSLVEAPRIQFSTNLSDKTLHTLSYILLSITTLWALWRSYHRGGRSIIICFVYTIVYGGLMEILQTMCTNTRTGEWLDLAADAIGATVGIVITLIVLSIIDKYFPCKKRS